MHYELVKVIDRALLLNPVQIPCAYRTADGRTLARGIYAVVWPLGAAGRRYDASAEYHGPFPSWRQAGDFVRTSLGLPGTLRSAFPEWSRQTADL